MIAAGEGIGAAYREARQFDNALGILDRSLALAGELEDQTRIAELLWRKAEARFAMGDFGEAARLSEKSLGIARQLRLPKHSYLAATMLGRALLKDRKTDLAYEALSQAIEQIESMRFSVAGREQERQIYFEDKVAAYHLMVELLIEGGKSSEALVFAERAKGRVLYDVMGAGGKRSPLPEREREEERRLNQSILDLNNEIRIERMKAAPDSERITELTSLLDSARLKYESFLNLVSAAHPELRTSSSQAPSLAMEDLGRLIPDSKTAMLEYVATQERIYLFVLTRPDQSGVASVRTYTIPIGQVELAGRVKQAHQMAAERNPAFTLPSREIYNLLIKPAEMQIRGKTIICVLPDGPLWDIPFQALQNGAGRYLIEDFAIHYAPSLAVLKKFAEKKVLNAKYDSLLAFAAPRILEEQIAQPKRSAEEIKFDPLPGAENEVKGLAQIFGPEHSKLFIGTEANERAFRSMAGAFGVIHFATHGMIFNRQPLYSYLLLSKDGTGNEDDGLLEAREIMSLNLRADLVVLSACETARGRVGAGEGIIGISWAFLVAGCRATVVSQWKVGSSVTSELMIHFYRRLKRDGGASKADALRMAALTIMKDGRYRHPFYWAGFIIVGDNH
jgi:CHAT domain-containing protein